ncbi:MAG: cytochrome c oxidase subunit II [Betaproteobacteria bacterium]|nr:cytochrome c oxidase subunit II [Betaproteobacteria bacterium]MCC6250485.1 cytochrome c oxidase subunit II [Rubrivivax sp.]
MSTRSIEGHRGQPLRQQQQQQQEAFPTTHRLGAARIAATSALGALGALLAGPAAAVGDLPGGPAVNQLNLHPAASRIAADVHWLHWMLLAICLVIFVAVFGVMFYSILKHRKSVGAKAATFHESTAVEIAWTIVPFIIVIAMGAMATRTVVAMKDTSNPDLTIKVTGYQWKWGYDYLKGEGEGIGFLSTLDVSHRVMSDSGKPDPNTVDYLMKVDNPLVVPVNRKVRIITTAADVIHAWMVPSLGLKQDAIPGFVRDSWFRAEKTGDYYGQCVELCGKEHAYMPIHVRVVSDADYAAWVAAQKKAMAAAADDPTKEWKLDELIARGEKVYTANCAACHRPDGKGAPPIKPLDGSAMVLNDPVGQLKVMLNGAANGAMPSWKQLSDTELAAVATYAKNSWGNKTGKLIQPAEVAEVRAGRVPATLVSAAAPAAAGAAPAAAAAPAATVTAGLPMSVLFAVGKSTLDAPAQKVLASAADYLKANTAAKVALSGFVDASGSAAQNAELAKQRAFAVRDALTKAGIAADRIELRKPAEIKAGAANAAEARRVDIVPAS